VCVVRCQKRASAGVAQVVVTAVVANGGSENGALMNTYGALGVNAAPLPSVSASSSASADTGSALSLATAICRYTGWPGWSLAASGKPAPSSAGKASREARSWVE